MLDHAITLYLFSSLKITLIQVFMLIGPGIILLLIIGFVAGRVEVSACRLMGQRSYLYLFGWAGTIVHELGHALMCILFLHKITDMQLFNPDPKRGTLGYVNHSYNNKNPYQVIGNFFISIGPVILGTIVIYFSSRLLIGDVFFKPFSNLPLAFKDFQSLHDFITLLSNIWTASCAMVSNIFLAANFQKWEFYVFLYLLFSIGSRIILSRADIKGARSGFMLFCLLLFIANSVIPLFSESISLDTILSFSKYYPIFYAILIFVLVMNLMLFVPLYLLQTLKSLK